MLILLFIAVSIIILRRHSKLDELGRLVGLVSSIVLAAQDMLQALVQCLNCIGGKDARDFDESIGFERFTELR